MRNFKLVERLINVNVISYIQEKNKSAIGEKRIYSLDVILDHFDISKFTFNTTRLKRDDEENVKYKDLISLIRTVPSNRNINPRDVLNFALFSSQELSVILGVVPTMMSIWAQNEKLSYIDVSLAKHRGYHRFLGSTLLLDLNRLYTEEKEKLRNKKITLSNEDVTKIFVGDLRRRQEKYEETLALVKKFFPKEIHLEEVGRIKDILREMQGKDFYKPKEVAELWKVDVGDVYYYIENDHRENNGLEFVNVSLDEHPRYAIPCDVAETFERKSVGRPKAFTPEEEEVIYKKYKRTGILKHSNIFALIAEDYEVCESTIRKIIKKRENLLYEQTN